MFVSKITKSCFRPFKQATTCNGSPNLPTTIYFRFRLWRFQRCGPHELRLFLLRTVFFKTVFSGLNIAVKFMIFSIFFLIFPGLFWLVKGPYS